MSHNLLLIATTRDARCLDPALLRPGRLHNHWTFSLPDQPLRKEIFLLQFKRLDLLSEQLDLSLLAKSTQGGSGADISHIVEKALVETQLSEEAPPAKKHKRQITTEQLLQCIERHRPSLTEKGPWQQMIS